MIIQSHLLLLLVLVDGRVVYLEDEVQALPFVLRHEDVNLLVVREHRVAYLGHRLGLLLLPKLLPEVGRKLVDFLISQALYLNLVLSQHLCFVVPPGPVAPVRVLHKGLTDLFLELGVYR